MQRFANWIQIKTDSTEPVRRGDVTVTFQSRAVTVRLPFGGVVWNRPLAVVVQEGGQTRRIPILDLTRLVQVALFGFSALVLLAVANRSASTKES